jgi:beta-phosphoglucomutase-like phosphatase (HAD superfamily)
MIFKKYLKHARMTNTLNLNNFDAVAFDFEGTLADTIPTHHATRIEAFRQHGFGYITREQHEMGSTYGSSHFDIVGGILYAAGEIDNKIPFHKNQIVLDVIDTKRHLFKIAADEGFDAIPGAIDFLKAITSPFIGQLAIVTSSEEEFVSPFLKRYGLSTYFSQQLIIGHESVITEGLQVKPSGDPYLLATRRMHANNMLVFEDTVSGVESAKKANTTVIALGFDNQNKILFEKGNLQYSPDAVVNNYQGAIKLLGLS